MSKEIENFDEFPEETKQKFREMSKQLKEVQVKPEVERLQFLKKQIQEDPSVAKETGEEIAQTIDTYCVKLEEMVDAMLIGKAAMEKVSKELIAVTEKMQSFENILFPKGKTPKP